MQEASDEEQAAMALKLMDNVKQMILDTVLEDYNKGGPFRALIDGAILQRINDNYSGSPMHKAVRQVITDQMSKY